MSTTVKIQLTPEAEKIVRNLQAMPVRVLAAIAAGMDKANQFAIAKIQADHLTGQGPFPPSEHKLGVRTNRLRGSVRASGAEVSGNTVTSAIGTNVKYAGIHEFGGRIQIPPRQGRVTLVGGLFASEKQLLKAIKRKRNKPTVRRVLTNAAGYTINMPERAPFRTGIGESAESYKREISKAIIGAMKGPAT